jgi:hypothetical protein
MFLAQVIACCMLTWLISPSCSQPVEEFQVHGPMDLHNLAMNKFMEMRKLNPQENLSYDGEFLQIANKHAVKRNSRKPDEAFSLRVMRY